VIRVRAVQDRACPEFVCHGCGLPVVRKGLYAFRWPPRRDDEGNPVEQVAPVVAFHEKCAPAAGKKHGDWELYDLRALPEYVAHNFQNFRLNRMPRAGHKGLPAEVRKKAAQRAAALLRDESEAQAETSPPVPPSAARAPEPAPRVVPPPEPEPEKPTGIVQPCISVTVKGPTPWDAETVKHCGQPSVPGKPWCFAHWADLFQNPALERLMHGRR
jgi:hypothetical protein